MKLTKLQLVEIIKEELNKTFPEASVQGGPLQTEAGFWEDEDLNVDLGENPYEVFQKNKAAEEAAAAKASTAAAQDKARGDSQRRAVRAAAKAYAEKVWTPPGAPRGLDAKAVQDLYDLSEDEYEQFKRSGYKPRWDLPPEKFWPTLFAEEAVLDPAVERFISMARGAQAATSPSLGLGLAAPGVLNPATVAFGSWAIGDWLKDWYKDARVEGRMEPIYADRLKAQRETAERREEKKLGVSPDISWKHARSPAYSPGHGHGWGWGSLEESKSLEELEVHQLQREMKLTKQNLTEIIKEELDDESNSQLVLVLSKLLNKLDNLDVSLDYLSAAVTGEGPLDIGMAQQMYGRAVSPHVQRRTLEEEI